MHDTVTLHSTKKVQVGVWQHPLQNPDLTPLDFLFVWFINNNQGAQGTHFHNKEITIAQLLNTSMKNMLYISKMAFSSYFFAVKKL